MNYTNEIKELKEFKLAKSVVYNFVLSIFITLALAVVAVYAFGLQLDIVLSDSMAPTFRKHDIVVVVKADEYEVGDIIEYNLQMFSEPITHRIIKKEGSGKTAKYTAKGDNTPTGKEDVVTYNQINGKIIGIIVNGEHIYKFIKSNYFLFIDIILGLWVLSSTISSENEMRKHNIVKD